MLSSVDACLVDTNDVANVFVLERKLISIEFHHISQRIPRVVHLILCRIYWIGIVIRSGGSVEVIPESAFSIHHVKELRMMVHWTIKIYQTLV